MVNLIGEHTDYNEGFVLPFAIDRRTFVAAGPRDDDVVCITSTFSADSSPRVARFVELETIRTQPASGDWALYPLGVAWALKAHLRDLGGTQQSAICGVDIAIDSDVPSGARALGASALRDVGVDDLDRARSLLDDLTFRRVRHIVTENQRVLETVQLLRTQGPSGLGAMLSASHRSMRDDFEISTPELDLAVDSSRASGAIGARMTGGGFGGTAIALVPDELVAHVGHEVARAFAGVGAALARLEAKVAIEELLAVAPEYQLVTQADELKYPINFLRSPERLVIKK